MKRVTACLPPAVQSQLKRRVHRPLAIPGALTVMAEFLVFRDSYFIAVKESVHLDSEK